MRSDDRNAEGIRSERASGVDFHGVNVAEGSVEVKNLPGLNLGAAAALAGMANRFTSQIMIGLGKNQVSAKSIVQLIILGAGLGSKLFLRAEGSDADEAVAAIQALFERQFGKEWAPSLGQRKSRQEFYTAKFLLQQSRLGCGRTKKMKTAQAILFAIFFGGGLALPARAQAPYNSGMTATETNNFNSYLNNHPKTAQELAANPQLAKDPNFYSTHPGLESFLASHPGVREELNHDPVQFMRTEEGGYQWHRGGQGAGAWGSGWHGNGPGQTGRGGGAMANFDDGYLDQHPEVAQQLAQNPKLVDDPQFRASHPGLDQYLAAHPEVRSEFQRHPQHFMTAEHSLRRRQHRAEQYHQRHG